MNLFDFSLLVCFALKVEVPSASHWHRWFRCVLDRAFCEYYGGSVNSSGLVVMSVNQRGFFLFYIGFCEVLG
jgi:hypothetical protein